MGDLRVIEGYRGSRERRFEALYLESYGRVFNYVRRRMECEADAEDIVAEAYMLAARHFDRFDPERARFSTWVIQIAINCMRSRWRRERPVTTLDEVSEAAFSVEDETEALADRELVSNMLAALSPEEVDLVLMKYRDGKRNVDIAAELSMNPSTVSTKLFNAINKMRAVGKGE